MHPHYYTDIQRYSGFRNNTCVESCCQTATAKSAIPKPAESPVKNRVLLLLDRFPRACVMPSATRGATSESESSVNQMLCPSRNMSGTKVNEPRTTPVQREHIGRMRPRILNERSGIPWQKRYTWNLRFPSIIGKCHLKTAFASAFILVPDRPRSARYEGERLANPASGDNQ